MDNNFMLTQAMEESRHHRRFHHTIYTLYITIYIALLGFQISFPTSIAAIRSQLGLAILVGIILFILIPLYVCRTIISYHKTINYLRAIIALNRPKKKDASHTEGYEKALDALYFTKYVEIITKGRNPIWIGRGHWFFIITFLCVVICDLIVFILLQPPT